MRKPHQAAFDHLLDTIESALEDLRLGALDGALPDLDGAGAGRQREVVGRLCEVIVSQRRAALRLAHVAAAVAAAVAELRDRIDIAAEANADMATSAKGAEVSAAHLSTSARRINIQANTLHTMMASAAEAASRVAESGQQVTDDTAVLSEAVSDAAASAAAIASSMKEIDRALGRLVAELGNTTSAVASIDKSIHEIDAGASETNRLSGEMASVASHGRDVVTQTAGAVETIARTISALGQAVEQLETRSGEVSEITQIIKTIAAQSKLLALNASIQAAHAGQAGRGFAVVAREIKQLSDSTTASTRDIESVIRTIRDEISAAVRQARGSSEDAQDGLTLAKAARDAIDAMSSEVELIRSRVLQISESTSSQAVETANVRRAVARVAEIAEHLRLTSRDHNAANQKVVGRVREISGLANRVRTAMAEQEQASLGITGFVLRLTEIMKVLDGATADQSSATEVLVEAVRGIRAAGSWSHASVASMAYTSDMLEQHVAALREEVARVRLPEPMRGGRIEVPLMNERPSLDPVLAFLEEHTTIIDCLFDRLVSSEENGRIAPALAERWEISGDGLRYTFQLRQGVRFHHGKDLVADDVRFSLERIARRSDLGSTVLASVDGFEAYRAGTADRIDGIETPATDRVVVRLTTPVAFFLGLFALGLASIVPRDLAESDPEAFGRSPVGTGPFRFVESTDERLRLARFEGYYDPTHPYVDELEFRFGTSNDDALDGVLGGAYAYTNRIPTDRLDQLYASAETRARLQSTTLPMCSYLLIQTRGSRLADPRARRAIAHAVDRGRLVAPVGSTPTEVVAEGLVPPCCPGYDPALRGPEYNPDLARVLLAESGYDMALPIRLVVAQKGRSFGALRIRALVEDLDAVGLRLEVREVKDIVAARQDGDFDMIEANWIVDYLDADAFTYWPFHSKFGRYRMFHGSEALDRLLEAARSATNPSDRAGLYRRVHYLFQELCPALVLFHRRGFVMQSPHVEGVRLYPLLPTVRPRDIWVYR